MVFSRVFTVERDFLSQLLVAQSIRSEHNKHKQGPSPQFMPLCRRDTPRRCPQRDWAHTYTNFDSTSRDSPTTTDPSTVRYRQRWDTEGPLSDVARQHGIRCTTSIVPSQRPGRRTAPRLYPCKQQLQERALRVQQRAVASPRRLSGHAQAYGVGEPPGHEQECRGAPLRGEEGHGADL